MTRSHGTKLHILMSKLRSGTSKTKAGALFWKSHCATCSPVYVILYHVPGSCKGYIASIGSNAILYNHKHITQLPSTRHVCALADLLLKKSRLIIEIFILAFWLGCMLLPWERGLLETRLKKGFCLFFKKSNC